MKKLAFFIVVVSVCVPAFAQENNQVTNSDSAKIINLQEVVVIGNNKKPQQQLVSFFKANNAATLEEIMSRLPEISLMRRGAYGMEPAIRYFNGGQINVQVDGMRIHGACTDRMDPATIYIEPVNLKSLEVQTANSGFMNGSSIGGTVNMKMAEPDFSSPKKITGILNSGYQTAAKSFYESLRLNYSTGKWAFLASGTYRNSKNYRAGCGDEISFSQFRKVNYSLAVKYQLSKTSYLKADVLGDDGWNIGYPALPMDVGYAAARIYSLSFHKEDNTKRVYKWHTKIYANTIRHFMDDSKRPDVPMHMDMPGSSKTVGLFSEAEVRINRKQKLMLRADGSATFLNASMTMYQNGQAPMYMLTWPDNRRDQYGISASWLWQADSLTQLQLTGRADYFSSVLTTIEAKQHVGIFSNGFSSRNDLLKNVSAQFTRKLGRRVKVTAGAGYAQRMPTASELFGFYLFNASDGYDYIGNPYLKTEQSLQADLAVLYSWKRSRVQLSGYYSKVKNFIAGGINNSMSSMTIGAKGVKTYYNINAATVAGAEASGFFKPVNAIDIVTTFRYTLARDKQNDPLPFVAPLKNITSIRYQPNRFSAQLETESALQQNQVSNKYGEDVTVGYFLLHSRIGYSGRVFKNSFELQAGVENIFDIKYHEHLDWGNISRPGRNFYLQLKLGINNR